MPPEPSDDRPVAGGAAGLPPPRSIFVPQDDPRRDAREAVDAILSDAFMGLLSILLLPIIILPLVVKLSSTVQAILDFSDVTIIVFFVVEYAAKLYLAVDRRAFFRSRWHLLDLAVIVLSFVTYLPLFALRGQGSGVLLLRLLRLPRAFAVGGRATSAREGQSRSDAAPPPSPAPAEIRQLDPGHLAEPRVLTWEELERHLASPDEEWIHLSNVGEADLLRLSALLRVPHHQFRLGQVDELWPHAGHVERTVLLFLQSGEIRYPRRTREFFTVARRGAVVALQGRKAVSVSPHGAVVFARVLEELRAAPEGGNFQVRVVDGLLAATLADYRTLFTEIQLEVAGIAETPRAKLPKDFLNRIYELHKTIGRLSSNLARFRELVARLSSGRLPIDGLDEAARTRLEGLADETTFLSETAGDAAESVRTIIDVYINQSSFETNRILKILAVITAVALIPATLGGLLGIDGPYDFQLWEVALVVFVSITFVGYCFIKLGWLRA